MGLKNLELKILDKFPISQNLTKMELLRSIILGIVIALCVYSGVKLTFVRDLEPNQFIQFPIAA